MKKRAKEYHKYTLRISEPKFQKLQSEASDLGVSINALIVLKLDNRIKKNGQ
jgi:predicted HicB family RNase H-like nuclease